MSQATCSLHGCARKHVARGLCRKHYYEAGHGFTPRPCKATGCTLLTSPKTARGLCQNHYALLRRNGSTKPTKFYPSAQMDAVDILFARSEPHGACVLWAGALKADGYGSVAGGLWLGATIVHRFSWMLVNGPIPNGYEIDHACHNADLTCDPKTCKHRRCVNPDHLELVDRRENNRRRDVRADRARAARVPFLPEAELEPDGEG